jgi:cupin 2 domain-containing protein
VSGNLFEDIRASAPDEVVSTLLSARSFRIERIVSTGQASHPGFWYDQEESEWVLLVSGSAALMFEGDAGPRVMKPGDYLLIPAHRRHRVEWTSAAVPTVWIAVWFSES